MIKYIQKLLSRVRVIFDYAIQLLFLTRLFFSKNRALINTWDFKRQILTNGESIISRISAQDRYAITVDLRKNVDTRLTNPSRLYGICLPINICKAL